ncbi:MAG: beta-lactamase family protein [Acidimicrobiia bacterium]|nr:beta-lactamase family protein [Acidimicrobiia bacterium]MDH5521068.1 beta-lactamase family protein [Acidimicrobiia bacterium]
MTATGTTALQSMQEWPVTAFAGAWLDRDGNGESSGELDRVFPLASVTKPLFAYAVLIAVEEGSIALGEPAGPEGSTVAHLLSHSSGLAPEATSPGGPMFAPVGARRIYSNQGFEVLGRILTTNTDMTPAEYLRLAVFEPLGMQHSSLDGSPAHGGLSTVTDLMRFCRELLAPTLIAPATLQRATLPFLPDLRGVLPGLGRQDPNPWGLGFEIRGHKRPHWTGRTNSSATYGHFGASGTFLWIDPERSLGFAVLTDRRFGPWAAEVWPPLCDAVVAAHKPAEG